MATLKEITGSTSTAIATNYACSSLALSFILIRTGVCLTTWIARHRNQGFRGSVDGRQLSPIFNRHSCRPDDMIMIMSIIPLMARLLTINFSLKYGTAHSLEQAGYDRQYLNAEEVERVVLGSKLVLVGRLSYLTFLWCMKVSVLIFYQRIAPVESSICYARVIKALWVTLFATYAAMVVITVAECRPIELYSKCAAATAQLYVVVICNLGTDLWLFVIPLPIIIKSRLPLTRKINLTALFSVGLLVMAATMIRLPVVDGPGKNLQDARSFMSAIEVGAAAFVANAPIVYGLIRTTFRQRDLTRSGTCVNRRSEHERDGQNRQLTDPSESGVRVAGGLGSQACEVATLTYLTGEGPGASTRTVNLEGRGNGVAILAPERDSKKSRESKPRSAR